MGVRVTWRVASIQTPTGSLALATSPFQGEDEREVLGAGAMCKSFSFRVGVAVFPSPPGLTRWSMPTCRIRDVRRATLHVRMDCRVKPGNDELSKPKHPRGADAPELCLPPSKKATSRSARPATNEGGGAPKGASNHGRVDARHGSALLRGALAFRRSTAALAKAYSLAQLRAALPGITGCRREDPPRRQCSEHLADRS